MILTGMTELGGTDIFWVIQSISDDACGDRCVDSGDFICLYRMLSPTLTE